MNDALEKIIKHAYMGIGFYQKQAKSKNVEILKETEITEELLQKLPVTEKKDVQENTMDFLDKKYLKFPYEERLETVRTSGSTGKYLKIYWDRNDMNYSLTELWYYRYKYYGIHPKDKYCYFFVTDYANNSLVEAQTIKKTDDGRSIGFNRNNLSKKKLHEICKLIFEFEPKYMLLQPSIAVLLADMFIEQKIKVPATLCYIELTGEFLQKNTKSYLEKAFKCKIANQYGCNEANSIAFECPEGNLHINKSSVFVEIIDNKEKEVEGDICITSLTNYAMPFIRYRLGDRGKIKHIDCKCKNKSPVICLIAGRANDYVIDKNNQHIPAYVFLKPIEYINEQFGNIIKQFQIIQQSIDCFTVNIALDERYCNWDETVKDEFLNYLEQDSLKEAAWKFVFYDNIFPNLKTGKLAYFYREF